MTFLELRKVSQTDSAAFLKIKVALMGDSPTQFLNQAIKGLGAINKFSLEIFETEIDQIDYQIFNNESQLYDYKPEIIIIFQSIQKLQEKFYKSKYKADFAEAFINQMKTQVSTISRTLMSQIIFFNFTEINDGVFGNFANKYSASLLYQTRKVNLMMMDLARVSSNVHIADLASLQQIIGREKMFAPNLYVTASIVIPPEVLPEVAKLVLDIIVAIKGKARKCLITDLDNTIWGGIIGDDGIANIKLGDLGIGKAFTDLQKWMKQLKERGILLAVCSKNDETIAKEPFEKHPEMILKLSDFVLFVANWKNKIDNIYFIQSTLNIGFDSMVFIDDNPFEREMVSGAFPEIAVPELPEDPAEYLLFLQRLNLFETISLTHEDVNRTEQYQVETRRTELKKSFFNEEDYLNSLEMTLSVERFNDFNFSRVAQLTQRSNQFNLRTIRYTDTEIQAIANDDQFVTFTFQLHDKFGDYGIISIVILRKQDKELFMDTWLMSCRVLNRTVEQFILNKLIQYGLENGFKTIRGEYLPTSKNVLVKDLLQNLGFKKYGEIYRLSISDFKLLKTYIN